MSSCLGRQSRRGNPPAALCAQTIRALSGEKTGWTFESTDYGAAVCVAFPSLYSKQSGMDVVNSADHMRFIR